MKVELNNAQGGPHVDVINEKGTVVMRVYFLKDGGIIQVGDKSVGCRLGVRPKIQQAEFKEADVTDGIEIGEI